MSAIVMPGDPTWSCRGCGCTDLDPCTNAEGETCYWVADGLCSACAGEDLEDALELLGDRIDQVAS